VKVGVLLPSFSAGAQASLAAARDAEAAGLHGVFAFTHLWPLAKPGRPAIWPFPLLGAVAASTSRIWLGTLVARVAVSPPAVLLGELVTLDVVSGGRFIAGVGTGDAKSAAEQLAYGLGYPPAEERRRQLGEVLDALAGAGTPAWVGGGSAATNAVARAHAATLNLWSAVAADVAREAERGPVSWGGRFPVDGPEAAAELLDSLATAGSSWAVFTWPGSVAAVAEAAELAGLELAPRSAAAQELSPRAARAS